MTRDLYGRGSALAALDDWGESDGRLLTVTGPPGVGKSSLVEAWAKRSTPAARIDLSDTSSASRLLARIAQGLEASVEGCRDDAAAAERVGGVLASRGELLLVLDDADPCMEALADHVPPWLEAAPACRFLLTSRERLLSPEARVLELHGLAPEDAATFLEARARASWPSSAPPAREVLVAIAERLDGLPLALELAATRLGILTPAELLARLDQALDLLVDRRGASLRAALETSWDLLSPAEQEALTHLGLLRGWFSVDLAEVALASEHPVVDLLQGLRERSLLERSADGTRHRLLQVVRALARERLASGPETAARRRGIARWLAARAEEGIQALDGPRPAEALSQLRRHLDDLLAAPEVAARGEVDEATSMAVGAALILDAEEPLQGCVAFLDEVLSALPEGAGPLPRARLQIQRARTFRSMGSHAPARRALEAARALPLPASLATELEIQEASLGIGERQAAEAAQHADRALALARERGAEIQEGRALLLRALATHLAGDLPRALIQYDEARSYLEGVENLRSLVTLFQALSQAHMLMGDTHAARDALREVAPLHEAYGHHRLRVYDRLSRAYLEAQTGHGATALRELEGASQAYEALLGTVGGALCQRLVGNVRRDLGDPGGARAAYEAAVEASQAARRPTLAAGALIELGGLALEEGDSPKARHHLQRALDLSGDADPTFTRIQASAYLVEEAAARGAPEEAEALLAETRETVAVMGSTVFGHLTALAEGHVALHRARSTEPEEGAEDLYAPVRACLGRVLGGAPGDRLVDRLLSVRLGARRLHRCLPRIERVRLWTELLDPEAEALVVDREAGDFRLPGGRWVAFGSRPLLHRLVGALVERHLEEAGASLAAEALREAGWPGERMTPASGSNRLHKALSVLRRVGFRPLLQASEAGWSLDPSLRVVTVPGRIEAIPR